MMITSDPNSEHYWQKFFKASPRIYLDGILQPKVVIADDGNGYIVRCVLDDQGRIQVDPNNSEEVWLEQVSGKVEIRIEDVA